MLSDVSNYNIINDKFKKEEYLELDINFNKENIINSISNYKLIPFYKYFSHSNTLKKFILCLNMKKDRITTNIGDTMINIELLTGVE